MQQNAGVIKAARMPTSPFAKQAFRLTDYAESSAHPLSAVVVDPSSKPRPSRPELLEMKGASGVLKIASRLSAVVKSETNTSDPRRGSIAAARLSVQVSRKGSADVPTAFRGQPLRQQIQLVHEARKFSIMQAMEAESQQGDSQEQLLNNEPDADDDTSSSSSSKSSSRRSSLLNDGE
jgi:hypothetical protein